MTLDPVTLVLRWAHVLAAIVAMGGLVFARFALVPTLAEMDEESRERIHAGVRRRWLPWVIGAITVLLVSGLLNFLIFQVRVSPPREGGLTDFVTTIAPGVTAEGWEDGAWMRTTHYHALFGAKFLLAMAAFYFASALVGRGAGTQWVRNDRAKWLSVTLGLSLAVVLLSGWMRQLHTGPAYDPDAGVRMGADGDEAGPEE